MSLIDWACPAPEAYASGLAMVSARTHDGRVPQEQLIEETPVSLVFNGEAAITLMATPLQAEALALGFCLSEGLIARADELLGLEALPVGAGLGVQIELPAERLAPLRARRRFGAAPGGCGLCGIEDQHTLLALPSRRPAPLVLQPGAIARGLAALQAGQGLAAASGGAHAAALLDAEGRLLVLAEDVSRHCALDKAIGLQAMAGGGFDTAWALVSSRASFELVAKCARVGLPLLAAVSAPTALARRAARQAGLGLIGFARDGRWTRYDDLDQDDATPLPR